MSAPHEVWVLHGHAHTDVRDLPKALQRSLELAPRYLRADLKCGECKFLKEDSDYSIMCVQHSWEIAAENPACMAFVPKGEGR